MSDYISREAAIEKIRVAAGCAECAGSSSALCVCNVCDVYNAIRLVKSLPAADVERCGMGGGNKPIGSTRTGTGLARLGHQTLGCGAVDALAYSRRTCFGSRPTAPTAARKWRTRHETDSVPRQRYRIWEMA